MRSHFLKNLWRWKCGIPEIPLREYRWSLADEMANWSEEFIALMRNRMRVGIYRYGSFRDPDQPRYDRQQSMLTKLKLYGESGNAEYLIDIANIAMIEFEKREHPTYHFVATDDLDHTEVGG